MPLATLVEVARHMGAPLPEKLAAEGSVSGSVSYTSRRVSAGGWSCGTHRLRCRTRSRCAQRGGGGDATGGTLRWNRRQCRSARTKRRSGRQLQYRAAELDLKITTRGLNIADMRSFGLRRSRCWNRRAQGIWRGWARYHGRRETPPNAAWSGEYELQNARIRCGWPGRSGADPSAACVQERRAGERQAGCGPRRARSRSRANIAGIRTPRGPHRFHIAIPETDAAELERLSRRRWCVTAGFLARTLRLGAAPVPEWLKTRRADGTISIGTLTVGDWETQIDAARAVGWSEVRLAHVTIDDRGSEWRFGDRFVRRRSALSFRRENAGCRL